MNSGHDSKPGIRSSLSMDISPGHRHGSQVRESRRYRIQEEVNMSFSLSRSLAFLGYDVEVS